MGGSSIQTGSLRILDGPASAFHPINRLAGAHSKMHLKAVTPRRALHLDASHLGWSLAFSDRNFCRRAGFAACASHRNVSGHKDSNSDQICITRKRGRKLHLNQRSAGLHRFPFVSKTPSRAEGLSRRPLRRRHKKNLPLAHSPLLCFAPIILPSLPIDPKSCKNSSTTHCDAYLQSGDHPGSDRSE